MLLSRFVQQNQYSSDKACSFSFNGTDQPRPLDAHDYHSVSVGLAASYESDLFTESHWFRDNTDLVLSSVKCAFLCRLLQGLLASASPHYLATYLGLLYLHNKHLPALFLSDNIPLKALAVSASICLCCCGVQVSS